MVWHPELVGIFWSLSQLQFYVCRNRPAVVHARYTELFYQELMVMNGNGLKTWAERLNPRMNLTYVSPLLRLALQSLQTTAGRPEPFHHSVGAAGLRHGRLADAGLGRDLESASDYGPAQCLQHRIPGCEGQYSAYEPGRQVAGCLLPPE